MQPKNIRSPEEIMYQAVTILRERGHTVLCYTMDAFIRNHGEWARNPHTFGGKEPGNFTIDIVHPENNAETIVSVDEQKLMDVDSDICSDPVALADWIETLIDDATSGKDAQ